MRCHELTAAIDVPTSATTVNGPAIDLGRLQAPFLPGNTVPAIVALRAAANAAIRLQGTDVVPEHTLVSEEAVGSTESDGTFSGALDHGDVDPGSVVLTIDAITMRDDGEGNLSSEPIAVESESVGSTESDGTFSGSLDHGNIVPGSVVLDVDGEAITDDGEGVLAGDGSATGTIDYETGAITLANAATEEAITGDYSYQALGTIDYANGLIDLTEAGGSEDVEADYAYLEFGNDAWSDLIEHEVTTAVSAFRFTETVKLPQWVRAQVETSGSSGAGAFGVYLLGN